MNEEYIRKQAVLERLRPFDHEHADLEHGNEHFINGIETAIEVIEDTPGEDVVKVKRADWKLSASGDGYVCTRCHHTNVYDKHFCPNCGAEMSRWR